MGKNSKSTPEKALETVAFEPVDAPSAPPIKLDTSRPEGSPTSPPIQGETPEANSTNISETKKNGNFWRNAVIVGGLAIVAAVAVRSCADDGSSKSKETSDTTTAAGNSKGVVCKDGYFETEDAYAAFRDFMPGDLTQAPNKTLNDKDGNKSLREYWIGNKNKEGQGVLCENPVASAVVYEAIKQALGEGATSQTNFDPYVENANSTADYWAQNNESMKEFLESTEFDSAILNATINKEAIVKSVYKIGTLSESIDGKHSIVQEKVDAELYEGTVFVLEFTQELNDSGKDVTSGQIMYIDVKSGVIYLAKGLGNVPDITPTTTTTTATSTPPNLPTMEIETPNNGGNTGGNGGNTGGNTGGNGGNTGGNGGNTGGNGGNTGGGGEPKPPTPPTTGPKPPTPPTPPTTGPKPPTPPTTEVKGSEITIPGAPN